MDGHQANPTSDVSALKLLVVLQKSESYLNFIVKYLKLTVSQYFAVLSSKFVIFLFWAKTFFGDHSEIREFVYGFWEKIG